MRRLVLAALTLSMTASAQIKIEPTAYGGWPHCLRMSNGEIEAILTTDVGPRVIRYAFLGGKNVFAEFASEMGKHGESGWVPRGGHRIWMGPEDAVLSYGADNFPAQAETHGDTVTLTSPVEKGTGLRKQMIVKMAAHGSGMEVTNRVINESGKTRNMASWGLTMMAPGGTGILLFPPRGTHPKDLPPTNPLVMWGYTDFSDPRWKFTEKYLMLRMDPKNPRPQKVGSFARETTGGYLLGTDLFIKQSTAHDPAKQPDYGCSYETFTNDKFLEMETLGEVTLVPNGRSVQHVERWSLHRGVQIPAWTI